MFFSYESQSSNVCFANSTRAFKVFPQLNVLLEAHWGATSLKFSHVVIAIIVALCML